MSELSKQALKVDNNTSFPNNSTNYITPAILRAFNVNVIDSLVAEDTYQPFTQSVLESLQALDAFTASLDVSFDALNAFTASASNSINLLNQNTQSVNSSVSQLNSYTASTAISISALNSATASLYTSASLGLVTASISGQTLTFTKGNGTTFGVSIPTGSNALSASYAETSSISRNVIVVARNGNASTLAAGTVVHITSAVGDNPIFTTASYADEALSSNTFGLLRYSSAAGADVEVVVSGVVTGVNTNPALGFAAGDVLYLSSSGQFTNIQPQAPNQIVTIGQVLRAQQNNGSIYVSINNGWELNELHNVQITSPVTNNLLAYESASYGLWKNKTYSQLGLATTGSNTFTGNQNVVGAVKVIGDALSIQGNLAGSGSLYSNAQLVIDMTTDPTNIYSTYQAVDSSNAGVFGIGINSYNSKDGGAATFSIQGGGNVSGDNTILTVNPNTPGTLKFWKPTTIFNSNVTVSGSLAVSSSLTLNGSRVVVSSQTGSFITSAQTASFATTGSNVFNGTQTISGSLLTNGGAIFGNNTSQYNSLTVSSSLATYPGNLYNAIQIDTDGGGQWTAGMYISTYSSFGSQPSFGLFGGGVGNNGDNNIFQSYGNLVRFAKNTQITGSLSVTGSIGVRSGSYSGLAINNITPVSSSQSAVQNIITLTASEYALITPVATTLYIVI